MIEDYFLYYSVPILIVYIFTYFYGRKTKAWVWKEYLLIALGPVLGILSLSFVVGFEVLLYFLLCGLFGLLGELILGLFCEKVLGRKLWEYKKYPLIGGHTSLLNFPFWAGGGMLFLLLAKLVKAF